MRKRRLRVRRTGALVLLIAFLVLLFELNRFLPGGWPGGGGEGGFRRSPVDTASSLRVRPPEGTLPRLPVEGVRVVLRAPGGGVPDDASAAVDRPGASAVAADAKGGAALRDARLLDAGLVARDAQVEVRHGPANPLLGGDWVVHLPPPPVPAARAPSPIRLRVLAAEDGRPLAGAAVTVRSAGPVRVLVAAEDGTVELAGIEERAEVSVEVPGRRRMRRWVHPREAQPIVLRVPRTPHLAAAFLDAATGARLEPERLRVIARTGEVLWEREPAFGEPIPPTLDVDGDLEGALLEVWTPAHPVVRVPLAGLPAEVRVPAGRTFTLHPRDRRSQRLSGGHLRACYVPDLLGAGDGTAEPVEVEVEAGAQVALPADATVRLLADAAASAPQALRVGPQDAPERVVRFEPGIPLDVVVTDARGEPVEGASVVVLASADGLRVTRRGRTLAGGTARIRDLPAGPVEVYAHAEGTAWSVEAVQTARGADPVTVALEPGRVLCVVVDSPLGLPLAGVRVHVTSEADDARDVVPPDAGPTRTREDGTLRLTDLPDRAYRLRLSLPGYRSATVDGVRPGPGIHFVTLVPLD